MTNHDLDDGDDERAGYLARLEERYDAELALRLPKVPPRFAGAVPDADVWAWAEQVLMGGDRWLLVQGPTGTGKTHQGWGAIRVLVAAMGGAFEAAGEADLVGQVRRLWPSEDAERLIDRLAETPLLFLDDLGSGKSSEWTEELLYRLLNRRYEARRPCLITSNLTTDALRAHLGDRVASRVAEAAQVLVLDGPDRRRS